MKLKTLTAAALMVLAGASQAAIIPGSPVGSSGELILNAYWPGADATTNTADDLTFNLDTGLTVNAFLAMTDAQRGALSWDFSNDPNWNPLKGNTGVIWNLYAGNVGAGTAAFGLPGEASTPKWGFMTTIKGGSANLDPLFGITGPVQVSAKIDAQANAIDTVNGSTVTSDNLSTLVTGDSPANFANFGGNFQGGWSNDNTSLVDTAIELAFIGRSKASGTPANPVLVVKQDFLEKATLSSNGVLTISAVPVPGAVWLLGSALAGMITFSRREKQFA